MRPNKISLILRTTPIEKIVFEGEEILIKRDDFTELVASGNKIRKLEYFFYKAKSENAKYVITCGAIQSNHARATTYLAKRRGLKPVLFLRGQNDKPYTGNLLLNYLMGAEINFVTEEQYKNIDRIMEDRARDIEQKEKFKVLVIPEGGSDELGLWGYVDAVFEMKDFIEENSVDSIFCAVSSGGTYAGLLLGTKLLNLDLKITGIIVGKNKSVCEEKIFTMIEKAIKKWNLPIRIETKDIILFDKYIGEGYAIPYKEELDIIKLMAKKGVILDPVYTGKAFYGFIKEKRNFKKPIFLHTGGIFSIFYFNKFFF